MITLTGEYLELRPLAEADLRQLLKVYQGTPLYFDALGDRADRLKAEDVRAQWEVAQATPGRTLLGVYHIETGLLIGAVDVQIGVPRSGSAAVWMLIWGGFQRQGYGQECMGLIEHWLIPDQGVETLCAIAATNEEGVSFLEMQGFRRTDEPATSPIGRGKAFWMCW